MRGRCIGHGGCSQSPSDQAHRHPGETGSGKRAVVKALAANHGIEDDSELERVYSGSSEQKLVVPRGRRDTLISIDLGDRLAPLNLITAVEPEQILVNETWNDFEF